jgi:hypothetical protein
MIWSVVLLSNRRISKGKTRGRQYNFHRKEPGSREEGGVTAMIQSEFCSGFFLQQRALRIGDKQLNNATFVFGEKGKGERVIPENRMIKSG